MSGRALALRARQQCSGVVPQAPAEYLVNLRRYPMMDVLIPFASALERRSDRFLMQACRLAGAGSARRAE